MRIPQQGSLVRVRSVQVFLVVPHFELHCSFAAQLFILLRDVNLPARLLTFLRHVNLVGALGSHFTACFF